MEQIYTHTNIYRRYEHFTNNSSHKIRTQTHARCIFPPGAIRQCTTDNRHSHNAYASTHTRTHKHVKFPLESFEQSQKHTNVHTKHASCRHIYFLIQTHLIRKLTSTHKYAMHTKKQIKKQINKQTYKTLTHTHT